MAALLIVSGLLFWQRGRRYELGLEAYRNGERMLAQGVVDQAVPSLRNALAYMPQDVKTRGALGLALIQSNQYNEAASYLSGVVKVDPRNGPAWMGLAEIARSQGDRNQALQLFQRALSHEWPAQEEERRKSAQLEYARLLSDAGRRNEAISLLLSMIELHGGDPDVGKKAAEMVKTIGSQDQAEVAFAALASRFPADSSTWLRLGDARFNADKDRVALEAYRHAATVEPGSDDAQRAILRVEEVLRLDPTLRGLSVRARARRWDVISQRVLASAASCPHSQQVEKAMALLKKPSASLEVSDQKVETTLRIWQGLPVSCRLDPVLIHIMAKAAD